MSISKVLSLAGHVDLREQARYIVRDFYEEEGHGLATVPPKGRKDTPRVARVRIFCCRCLIYPQTTYGLHLPWTFRDSFRPLFARPVASATPALVEPLNAPLNAPLGSLDHALQLPAVFVSW